MSYSFCFGPSGSGKSRFLRRMLIERAQESLRAPGEGRKKYIFIVPEQYSMQTQRDLVREHPSHVLMNIDVLSFGRLAHRVFEETGADRRTVLDDIGKSLLLRRVASQCREELRILQRGIHSPGMIDEIKSVLSEFMQYGVDDAGIRKMAEYAGKNGQIALQARLSDLETLYTAFRKAEKDRYVTSEETLDLLAAAIPRAESLQGSAIVFDGFTGFTTVQYRVILELIRCSSEVFFSFTASRDQGPDISVTAGGGPAGKEENLFYLSRRTVYDIIRMAKKEGLRRGKDIYVPTDGEPAEAGDPFAGKRPAEPCEPPAEREAVDEREPADGKEPASLPRFAGSRVLGHLEGNLFRYPEIPFCEKREGETARSLRLLAASTPQEEVRQIFARVRRLIAKTGCAYRDFAIVTADLETYGDLFALEAERSGIPVYIDRTSGAFHNILIEGIRSVLQISVDSFSYASVFRYLRSGLSRLTMEEADLLENYCLANGIRGRKKWSSPFDASCEEARIRLLRELEPVTGLAAGGSAAPGKGEPVTGLAAGGSAAPGSGEPEDGTSAETPAREPARRRARTAAVRTRELYAFLTGCDAQMTMEKLADEFSESGDVVREKQYRQIYREVIDLLDQIYDLAGEEVMSARDYLELLEAGFSQIRLGTIPQRVDRILVGDIERTRLTQIRHLFFAGANEGNIPRSAARGGILSDMDREFLFSGPVVLAPTPRQQMFTQRLYLYLNMTKPSETLTVSFAKTSQAGKGLRPSYLIALLRGLFPALRVQIPEEQPARRQITCAGDGLRMLADSLRLFVEGSALQDPSFMDEFVLLYGFYTSPEAMADPMIRSSVSSLRRAALAHYRPELLQAGLARAVYGDRIVGGISRMETGARCYLMQHLRYGLRLRERDLYEFSYADGGTVLHAALQRFDALLRAEDLSWLSFSDEDARRLAARALREETAVYRNLLLYKSARDESRISRYEKRLLRTVDTLRYQLRQGDFRPVAAELSFGGAEAVLPPIRFDLGGGRTLVLIGRIDRVDMCADEAGEDPEKAGGRRYLRIMDYKSGYNDLDADLIRQGLQLQLITYMQALLQAGGSRLDALERTSGRTREGTQGDEAGAAFHQGLLEMRPFEPAVPGAAWQPVEEKPEENGEIVPSAILYYRMADPVLKVTPEEALRISSGETDQESEKIRRELRPTGLVCDDERSIAHLDKYFSGDSDVIPVGRKKDGGWKAGSRLIAPAAFRELAEEAEAALCRVARDILDGNVSALPAELKKGKKACEFCVFREACAYDPRIPGFEVRRK